MPLYGHSGSVNEDQALGTRVLKHPHDRRGQARQWFPVHSLGGAYKWSVEREAPVTSASDPFG